MNQKTEIIARQDCEPDFFVEEPPEVGEVLIAYTTLAQHEQPQPVADRCKVAALVSLGTSALWTIGAWLVYKYVQGPPLPLGSVVTVWLLLVLATVGISFGVAVGGTSFVHHCGFIGSDGCALYRCRRDRDQLNYQAAFRYEDAAFLRVKLIHNFYNGGYTHTAYWYTWTDRDDKVLLAIADNHNAHNAIPAITSTYQFACAAEHVWSEYLTQVIADRLNAGQWVDFPLAKSDYIRVRRDVLQLCLRGVVQDFAPEDIAEMQIACGKVALKEPGARSGWFTESGYHRFDFADIANARVFLLLMNQLFQVPIR